MPERRVAIADPSGLHARQAAGVVQLVSGFDSRVRIRYGGREADARSLIGILGLAVGPAAEVIIVAEGADASETLDALALHLARGPAAPRGEPDTAPSSSGGG